MVLALPRGVRLVEAVGEGGGRGLVEDADDVEAGDLAGVLGGLALRVVEVGGDGDHRLAHLLLQLLLHELLDLAQHQRRDLLRAVMAVADLDLDVAVDRLGQGVGEDAARPLHLRIAKLAADQPLDGVDRVLRIGDRLALGDLADQAVPLLREGDDRSRGAAPLAIRQHHRDGGLHDRGATVRRTQVDAEDLAHSL